MSVSGRVTAPRSPLGLAILYAEFGRDLVAARTRSSALDAVLRVALERVPGTAWASITEGHNGTFATVAATDEAARQADEIQYALATGPCVDAILQDTTFRTGDLSRDGRWPDFGKRASETFHVRSMLSFRLYLEDDDRIAGLNLYSTKPEAFDDSSVTIGTLLATHGAVAIAAAAAREQAAQLKAALYSNRDIGVAMGILMATYKVTRDQAFDLLRIASQNTNRKLRDLAVELAETGTLELPSGIGRNKTMPRSWL